MDEKTVVNRARASRDAVYDRTSSPARRGRRLLAMNPTAMACHSGVEGYALPFSRRKRRRQRIRRRGKVSVAMTTAPSSGPGSAALRC